MTHKLKNIVNDKSLEYLEDNGYTLRELLNYSENELKTIPYIGTSRAKSLKKIFEFSKALAYPSNEFHKVQCPKDAFEHLKFMTLYEEERFVTIYLDTKNQVLNSRIIAKGTINSCLVHPREVFSPAIRMKANSIIVCHNHPSGHLSPSHEDIQISKRLVEAGEIVGIKLMDHIIIGNNSFISLKERGEI